MTFSLISVAILLITAFVIVIEIVRAINRGRKKTLVTLASILLSVFISILITNFLSNLFAKFIVKFVKSKVDLSNFSNMIESMDDILFAYMDSLIAPLTFFVVFILVRLLVALTIKLVYNVNKKKVAERLYECEDAPNSKKKPKLINGLLGALCGFMVMVITLSPFVGTLKMVTKAFKSVNSEDSAFGVKIKDDAVWFFDRCSDDLVGTIFYYSGGILVYKSVATSKLNDNHFALEREIDNTILTADDLMGMMSVLNRISTASEAEKNMLRNLGANVDKAETLKAATADILPVLSKKWINDEPYEGATKPKVSKASESFFDKMLYVCTKSTPDTVGADLSSLLNVYIIAFENDLIVSENYKEMLEKARISGAFELIKQELRKNPRMAGIDLELNNTTMKSIASAIQTFNPENYDNLMNNITSILNNAINLDGQQRLEYITRYTKDYINQHGINLGDDVVNEISQRFIDELVDHKSNITVDDLKAFWDKYSVVQKSSSNTDADTQPTPEVPPQTETPETDSPIEIEPSDDLVQDDGGDENFGGEEGGEDNIEVLPEETVDDGADDSYAVEW